MIPINLLPYRAERRKELHQQFITLAALTAVIGGIYQVVRVSGGMTHPDGPREPDLA